jgi:2-succinyl-6-hydroxy-2,4-cyclohexadiene-1-carboxylate synthase
METELSKQYFMNSLVETVEGVGVLFSPRAMALNAVNDDDWFHLLPQIQRPVLLLRAKKGGAVTDGDFAKMQSLLPDCTACEASNPDHNVHLSDKDEFYGYFDAFLAKVSDLL